MVEFRLEVKGLREIPEALAHKAAALEVATRVATGLAAHIVERHTKDLLRRTSHTRHTPTPSQPGEPPALVSGSLMRSIAVEGPTGIAGTFRASVGPTLIYGRIQELGGVTGRGHASHLPARPYLRPALAASREEIATLFYTAWRRALES